MGNIIDSVASGFTKAIADILAKPLDFLSGKTCSSACGSTWDIICYVENFCVANLAKMAAILFLLYLACKKGCTLVCNKMRTVKRARQERRRCFRGDDDIEGRFYSGSSDCESEDTARHRRVNHRHERALHHGIKVTHTSPFVHKGGGRRADYR
ncbi:hypothetical protein BRADI_5g27575v3 [Brachypodium distachyon]|uniref:Uncharacterized protein n=1 Tax=Brachypodium distachyon TaxID=15368 RepID=A0A2K2CJN3_BRADI|nr:hypothetical protein BRADI_5g27575v3 [Brachypodium distachyon]